MEKGEGEHTVPEEEVCAGRERIHPVLLQQGECGFFTALTQPNHTSQHLIR